ncbi:MAG: hypothetical protein OXF88_18345 [Rhodobacteraceae bacterium]|nr:hypothetical protein [Paracoccaceae bacterium]MCY4140443.1 hypothetical protein [Paracoccaceae bacterium]
MAVGAGAVSALRTAARSGLAGSVAHEAIMPAVLTDDPVPGPVYTERVMASLIAASRARPGTCLHPVFTGGASAGLARADDFCGSQEKA